jgi:hypothetical protein
MKNDSRTNLQVNQVPKNGVSLAQSIVKPAEWVAIDVPKNTALVVDNKSNTQVSVLLKIVSRGGLSMGYKSQN